MLSDIYLPHDVHLSRMTGAYLNITNYDSATAVDHTGWSAAASSGVFAQWFILPCRVISKGLPHVFELTQ